MKKNDKNNGNSMTPAMRAEIEIAFARLIGPLATITALPASDETQYKDYKKILPIVLKWAADFQINKDLSRINHLELIDIYDRLDELKTYWLFDRRFGLESELADTVLIWLWELMLLRKDQIEGKGEK